MIVTTDHSNYDYEKMVSEDILLYNTRSATKNVRNYGEKINKL